MTPYLMDDTGTPLVRCDHCRRTREATGPDDEGPWACPRCRDLDADGQPPDGPPSDEGSERAEVVWEVDR